MNMTDELILQSWIRAEQRNYQLQPLHDLPNELGGSLFSVQPGGKWLWSQGEVLLKALKSDESFRGLDFLAEVFEFHRIAKPTYTNSGSFVAWRRFKSSYETITLEYYTGLTMNILLRMSLWYYQTPVVKAAGLLTKSQYDLYCDPAKHLMATYLGKEDSEECYAAAETEAEMMVEEMRRSGRLK